MSDAATVQTPFQLFGTIIRSRVAAANEPATMASSALLFVDYRVKSNSPWMRRIDVNVIPGTSYALQKPIEVTLRKDGTQFLAESKDLDILEAGMSEGEALEEFCRFFAMEAQSLLNSTDDSLGEDALQLRNRYRKYIRS